MRSIQTDFVFPLSSVKPLDGLLSYREYCLAATRKTQQHTMLYRQQCPACASILEPFGRLRDLDYVRCPLCESIFLKSIASPVEWARLLVEISQYRRSPQAFHSEIAQSRSDNVYLPKLEWIQSTLRMQEIRKPRVMEVATFPSDFTSLLRDSGLFTEVLTVDEMKLAATAIHQQPMANGRDANSKSKEGAVEAAVLLESLDRVDDPGALLGGVQRSLTDGGLLFVTALVCSGFDMAVLGLRNLYLYPPDRTNCFSLRGLELLFSRGGFTLLEVSTPGVLDVEIVEAHLRYDPSIPLSAFERKLLTGDSETHAAFQEFLQRRRMSSFARIVGKKQ